MTVLSMVRLVATVWYWMVGNDDCDGGGSDDGNGDGNGTGDDSSPDRGSLRWR